jgi:hypothetical protein
MPHVQWESRTDLERRVARILPALSVARVDGLSPVEYLDDAARAQVRDAGTELVLHPADDLLELGQRWRDYFSQ